MDEKKRNNAACSNIWKLSIFLPVTESLSKKGTPVIHRASVRNTATAEQCMRAEASGKTSIKNKRNKKRRKTLFFFFKLCADAMTIWWVLFFLLSCKLIACSWERAAVLMSILLSALSYKLSEKAKKSSIMEKGKGVWQCQELYPASGAHIQRDWRQVHIVKQSCSGGSVVPMPSTKRLKFCLPESWDCYKTAWLFHAVICSCDLNSCGLCCHGFPCNHRDTFCIFYMKAVAWVSTRKKWTV